MNAGAQASVEVGWSSRTLEGRQAHAIEDPRLIATYVLRGPARDAARRAQAIAIEQSIEFPIDLVRDERIRGSGTGRVDRIEVVGRGATRVDIGYPISIIGEELGQMLVVLFGNCSMLRGVRLVGIELPIDLARHFPGPRFGIPGLRKRLMAPDRPLLATALKPVGSSSRELALLAQAFATGGFDLIKEDQSLANQGFAPFAERVRACVDAVGDANGRTGGRSMYLPSVNAPVDQIMERALLAKEAGADGLLVLPGVVGLDTVRALGAHEGIGIPLMAHPSLTGSFVASGSHGIAPDVLYGTLMRLAGADVSAFVTFGGRFAVERDDCLAVADACRAPMASMLPSLPAAGGGVTLETAADVFETYGSDVAVLIGGAVHRGDIADNARRLRDAAESFVGRTVRGPHGATQGGATRHDGA